MRAGQTGRLGLLVAQQALSQTSLAAIQARAAKLADTAALMQALGGGWEQQPFRTETDEAKAAPQ